MLDAPATHKDIVYLTIYIGGLLVCVLLAVFGLWTDIDSINKRLKK
jgi:hypothetical protein